MTVTSTCIHDTCACEKHSNACIIMMDKSQINLQ